MGMTPQRPPVPAAPAATGRRQFLADSARAVCAAGLVAGLLGWHARQAQALPADLQRPPGALPEPDFLAACVRCGLCVRDCPYDILELAQLQHAAPLGTPVFRARTGPCEMCEDIPCARACPTGALAPSLTDITQARMGVAVLVDGDACLNLQGLRCDVCYRVCPLLDQAITLEPHHNPRTQRHAVFVPTVHPDACTGCGKCEHACVLEAAAIRVLPLALARSAIGAHYRLGWQEQQRAGGSLIDESRMLKLPARRPEDAAAPEAPR